MTMHNDNLPPGFKGEYLTQSELIKHLRKRGFSAHKHNSAISVDFDDGSRIYTVQDAQNMLNDPNSKLPQLANREKLIQAGVPEHLLDVSYDPDLAFAEAKSHIERAADSLAAAGGWLALIRVHIGADAEFIAACEARQIQERWAMISLYCNYEKLKTSPPLGGGEPKRGRKRLTSPSLGGVLPSFSQMELSLGLDSAESDADPGELQRDLRQAQTQIDIERQRASASERARQNAEWQRDELKRKIEYLEQTLAGERLPDLDDVAEQNLVSRFNSHLKDMVAARKKIALAARDVRRLEKPSAALQGALVALAAAIDANWFACQGEILCAIGDPNKSELDLSYAESDADAAVESFQPHVVITDEDEKKRHCEERSDEATSSPHASVEPVLDLIGEGDKGGVSDSPNSGKIVDL